MATVVKRSEFFVWKKVHDNAGVLSIPFEFGDFFGMHWALRQDRREGSAEFVAALNAGLRDVIAENRHLEIEMNEHIEGAIWPSNATCKAFGSGTYVPYEQLSPVGRLKRALDSGRLIVGTRW